MKVKRIAGAVGFLALLVSGMAVDASQASQGQAPQPVADNLSLVVSSS